jgi:hypothetical protein
MAFALKGWPQDVFRLRLANEAGLFVRVSMDRVYHKSRTASPELDDGLGSFTSMSRCPTSVRFAPYSEWIADIRDRQSWANS